MALAEPSDAIICFRCDNDQIVVGTKQHRLMLFKLNSATFYDTLYQIPAIEFRYAHSSPILCLDNDFPDFLLASGDAAGTLALWNVFNGELIARQKRAHDKGISCLLAINSSHVITAGFDKMIRLFRIEKHSSLTSLNQDSSNSLSLGKVEKPFWKRIFSKNEKKAAPIANVSLVKEFRGHRGEIYCLTTCCKGTLFASGSTDKTINVRWCR